MIRTQESNTVGCDVGQVKVELGDEPSSSLCRFLEIVQEFDVQSMSSGLLCFVLSLMISARFRFSFLKMFVFLIFLEAADEGVLLVVLDHRFGC